MRPLAGIVVVAVEQAVAAPICTRHLGHARLNRPTELLEHPQLTQRDRWQEIGSPAGPVLGLLPPPVVPGWEWRLDPIPALGEHTAGVLRELGFAADEIEAMRAAGAVGAR